MLIYVALNLSDEDEFTMSSDEAAQAVLDALGGDAAKDHCTVQVTVPAAHVGPDPVTPPLPPDPGSPVVTVLAYKYSTGTGAPSDQQLRRDASPSTVTAALLIDKNTTDGSDASGLLLGLAAADMLELRSVSNPDRYVVFTVVGAPVDQTSYVQVPVEFQTASATEPAAGNCTLTVTEQPS